MEKIVPSLKRSPSANKRGQRSHLDSSAASAEPWSPHKVRDPEPTTPPLMRHLRTPEAARYLGVSTSFLNHARLRGTGPAYRKLSAKVVCYSLADLQAWAESKTKRSTSGAPP